MLCDEAWAVSLPIKRCCKGKERAAGPLRFGGEESFTSVRKSRRTCCGSTVAKRVPAFWCVSAPSINARGQNQTFRRRGCDAQLATLKRRTRDELASVRCNAMVRVGAGADRGRGGESQFIATHRQHRQRRWLERLAHGVTGVFLPPCLPPACLSLWVTYDYAVAR